jgi:hypothetical protein
MIGQEKGGEHAALFFDAGATGLDFHALFASANARGRQDPAAHIHYAQPAHSYRLQPGMMAEDRDFDPQLTGGFPNRRAQINLDGFFVNMEINH